MVVTTYIAMKIFLQVKKEWLLVVYSNGGDDDSCNYVHDYACDYGVFTILEKVLLVIDGDHND